MDNPFGRWKAGDKVILIVIVLLLLSTAIGLTVYLQREGIIRFGNRVEYVIGPVCGPIPTGGIEDMIADEGSCRNQCRSRCEAGSLRYKTSSIRPDPNTGCNICDCVCS